MQTHALWASSGRAVHLGVALGQIETDPQPRSAAVWSGCHEHRVVVLQPARRTRNCSHALPHVRLSACNKPCLPACKVNQPDCCSKAGICCMVDCTLLRYAAGLCKLPSAVQLDTGLCQVGVE